MDFNKRKFVQFVGILYLLSHGKPMVAFENMKSFLELLKVKHYPKKHLCDNASWGMAKAFHTIVMQAMMLALDKVNVFAMF